MVFCKQKTAYELRISDWSSDVCSSDLPKSSSSEGSSFGFANGLETQVSLIRSRQVMLLLVLLPPQEPQPSEKVWRMPFHRLPLFDGACGWFTITRDVLVALASFMMFSSLRE